MAFVMPLAGLCGVERSEKPGPRGAAQPVHSHHTLVLACQANGDKEGTHRDQCPWASFLFELAVLENADLTTA